MYSGPHVDDSCSSHVDISKFCSHLNMQFSPGKKNQVNFKKKQIDTCVVRIFIKDNETQIDLKLPVKFKKKPTTSK